MQTSYLVTTADERTWPDEEFIIFLGGWCQSWKLRHKWSQINAVVAAPYGIGEQTREEDYARARILEASLFPDLCNTLGRLHGVTCDQRYWRIILGHWFRRYVDLIFNRTRTLEVFSNSYKFAHTIILSNSSYRLAVQDSYSAIWACNDDRWNHSLYARIMELMPSLGIRFETVIDDSGDLGFSYKYKNYINFRTLLLFGLRGMVDRVFSLLHKHDDLLIFNSYLPRWEELKLQLMLGQYPRLPSSNIPHLQMESDANLRGELSQQSIDLGSNSGSVEHIARSLLFELLPVCYLEAFASIKEHCENLPWPDRPRAVFNSNNFDTDEIFKSWTADKVMQGTKYVIGQHGNNYGTHRYFVNPSIEEMNADRFVTWGWQDELPQHLPVCMLKNLGKKTLKNDPEGDLLLIELPLPYRFSVWDEWADFDDYFEDQKRFVSELRSAPRKKLLIRLHQMHEQMGWGECERWAEFDSTMRVDLGDQNINKLIAASRLVVHSYDSTGILETLSQDIPTVAFWQRGLEHVRDSARPWYQLLVDAGIVHLSARSAAVHVSEVWDDIGGWWSQDAVRNARMAFCQEYACSSKHPLRKLKDILIFN